MDSIHDVSNFPIIHSTIHYIGPADTRSRYIQVGF